MQTSEPARTLLALFLPPGPDPAGANCLFTNLSTASLRQNCFPLNLGFLVCVNRVGDVKSEPQALAGAGVNHGPLFLLATVITD